MQGWLYAIVAIHDDVKHVKIGWTAGRPESRMASFQIGSPVLLGLHSETWHEDVLAAEKAAHDRLAHAHVHGEWYDMADYEVDQWLAERERDTNPLLH